MRQHDQDAAALHALGDAIATVARAILVGTASSGRRVGLYGVDHVAAYYGPGPVWLIYAAGSHTPTREIASPHPADAAAQVVDILIEEANR